MPDQPSVTEKRNSVDPLVIAQYKWLLGATTEPCFC